MALGKSVVPFSSRISRDHSTGGALEETSRVGAPKCSHGIIGLQWTVMKWDERDKRISSCHGFTKGWVCRVAEKDGDWLGSYTWPHTQEVWTSMQFGWQQG
jgi:hypothetical protein